MPCEPYKNALVEAAATGAEPVGELLAHLAACAACYTTFAEEQALFSSIDTGLSAAVNAELPASLLPRVRARIAEQPTPARGWTPTWLAMACAPAIIVALIAVYASRRTNVGQTSVETATQSTPPAQLPLPPMVRNPDSAPPSRDNSVPQLRALVARNSVPQQTLASRNPVPEVLVPRDQEVLMVRYAEQWRGRKRPPLLAESSSETPFLLLQIAPIQIAQLDVKLLTEEQGQ
jgi:hypothetical protein